MAKASQGEVPHDGRRLAIETSYGTAVIWVGGSGAAFEEYGDLATLVIQPRFGARKITVGEYIALNYLLHGAEHALLATIGALSKESDPGQLPLREIIETTVDGILNEAA